MISTSCNISLGNSPVPMNTVWSFGPFRKTSLLSIGRYSRGGDVAGRFGVYVFVWEELSTFLAILGG